MGMGNVSINEIVTKQDQAVTAGSSVRQLLQAMRRNHNGVVVVLEGGRPIGIMTERDIVGLLHAGVDMDTSIDRYARKPLVQTLGERKISYAVNLMVENNIRRLIVIDNNGEFLGVVTQKDLFQHMEDDFSQTTIKVRHILDRRRPLVATTQEETISQVLAKMVSARISSVPVIEDRRAVGIITEKDILRLAGDNVPLTAKVGDHMSSPVVAAGLETSIVALVKEMNQRNIRRLVINDNEGLVIGVLTSRDLARNVEGDYNQFLERKLKHTKEVMNLFPEMLLEVIDLGDEQLVIWANEKVVARFGKSILDKSVTELIPEKRWREIFPDIVGKGKVEDVRFKRGAEIFEFSGFYLPLDKDTEKGRIQLILRDITEEVSLATTDSLTNIYNRRYVSEFLANETERSRRLERFFSLAIMDLDDFKQVNDTHGHMGGDAVLRAVVEVLKAGLRNYDVIGRYGGEEFLVILPEVGKERTMAVIDRLRHAVETLGIELPNGHRISVTASFGVATFAEDGTTPEDLLVRADERLYSAKRQGKNRVVGE
ncbi:MAG: hypothetical protein A2521_12750 [Deltaproteobacteria bacterium RIFOXYD12_FULL_57_12]|nr:MAG: hypothetical protein A2521_12750 [Deltaproteobacteria bacterium RIFOXYD12_FULL_57_12]